MRPSSPTATSVSASSTAARKREQAQGHLAIATTMYYDMGMTYRLEKAEADTTDSVRTGP